MRLPPDRVTDDEPDTTSTAEADGAVLAFRLAPAVPPTVRPHPRTTASSDGGSV